MRTEQTPSATAATMSCPRCGGLMIIQLVEPKITAVRLERHTFKCTGCSLTQGFLIDPPPVQPAVPAR